MQQDTKKIIEEELESKVQEIEHRFQAQIEQELNLVKEQLKVITASTSRMEQIEKDFQRHVHEDLEEIRRELKVISSSTAKMEREISDRWNILVKLRSHSYDKLMSEYRKVEKKILIEGKTSEDIAPKEKKEI